MNTTEAKLDRIIQLLEQIAGQRNTTALPSSDARSFLDGLRGMSVEEMRAANRERNRRLKEAAQ